jgi:hypothetical protein
MVETWASSRRIGPLPKFIVALRLASYSAAMQEKPDSRRNGPHDDADADADLSETPPLREGTDYYLESGLMILTKAFLLRRGSCCQNGCRHCPYEKTDS